MSLNIGVNRLYPEGTPRASLTERRCNGCRQWYTAELADCPECGTARPTFNPAWRQVLLRDNLNRQREQAIRDA